MPLRSGPPDELQLIEANEVTEAVAEAHSTYSRFHDLYDGLTWRLCRDPVPDQATEFKPETFLVKSHAYPYPGFCVIYLVYTFDEETIYIEDLWTEPV